MKRNEITYLFITILLLINNTLSIAQCLVAESSAEHTEDYLQIDDDDGTAYLEDTRLEINGTLYFTADDGKNGNELWKIDGTTGDIILIKDIAEGPIGSRPDRFIEFDGKLMFNATDQINGSELWISDGTESGTFMLKDINTGSLNSYPGNMTQFGDEIYFAATQNNDRELWKTDGTTQGTVLAINVGQEDVSSSPQNLAVVGDELFFDAFDVMNGRELWKSDGTLSGTGLVKNIKPAASSSNISDVISDGTRLWFNADDGATGTELWVSDGSEVGTYLVKDIYPTPEEYNFNTSSRPNSKIVYNSELYFRAFNAEYGATIWKSDGTEAGTVVLKDIFPGGSNAILTRIVEFNSMLYFGGTDGTGPQLWKSDGTSEGTVLVKQINGLGNQYCEFDGFIAAEDKIVFSASDGTNGMELWMSDGTESGTYQVEDINVGYNSSNPSLFNAVGQNIYFTATDGIRGFELWDFNCVTGDVSLVRDINSTIAGPSAFNLSCFDNQLFYRTNSSISDLNGPVFDTEITEANQFPSFSSHNFYTKLGSNFILEGFNGEYGSELWVTDGTVAGTSVLKDITVDGHTIFQAQVVIGDKLYFGARSPDTGSEPWVSDGTEAGTVMLKDIIAGTGSSGPIDFIEINGTVYFNTQYGIWKTDGTPNGTVQLTTDNSFFITKFGSSLIFRSSSTEFGSELWISDGTPNGTTMIKDINPGIVSSNPRLFTVFGDDMYFTATTHLNGLELWKTDGTTAGTQIVKDINAGALGTDISDLISTDSHLYFVADISSNGSEMWKTDGTGIGTLLVKDINQGSSGSGPSQQVTDGTSVYFLAFDGESRDIWSSDGTPQGTKKLTAPSSFNGSASYVRQLISCGGNVYFTSSSNPAGIYSFNCDDLECVSTEINTWHGPSVDNWNKTPVYWGANRIPTTCDDVIIPSGYNITVQSDKSAESHTIQVDLGAQLNVLIDTDFEVNNK